MTNNTMRKIVVAPLAAGLLLTGLAMPWAAQAADGQTGTPSTSETTPAEAKPLTITAASGEETVKTVKDWNLKAGNWTVTWTADEGHDKSTLRVLDKDGNAVYTAAEVSSKGEDGKVKTVAYAFKDKDGKDVDHITLADGQKVALLGYGTATFVPFIAPADANKDGKVDANDLKGVTATILDKDGNPAGTVEGFDGSVDQSVYTIPADSSVFIDNIPAGWTVAPAGDGVYIATAPAGDGDVTVTWTFQPKAAQPTDPFEGFTDDEKAALESGTVLDASGKPVDWFKPATTEYWKLTPDQLAQAVSFGLRKNPTAVEATGGFTDKDGKPVDVPAGEGSAVPEGAVTWTYVITGKTSKKTITYTFSTLDKPAEPAPKPQEPTSFDVAVSGEDNGIKQDTAKNLGIPAGDYTVSWKPGAKPGDAKVTVKQGDKILYTGQAPADGGAFALKDAAGEAVDHITLADDTTVVVEGLGTATFTKYTAPADQDKPQQPEGNDQQQPSTPTEQDKPQQDGGAQQPAGGNGGSLPQTGVVAGGLIAAIGTMIAGIGGTVWSKRSKR